MRTMRPGWMLWLLGPALLLLTVPVRAQPRQTAAERCVTAFAQLSAAVAARDRAAIEARVETLIALPGCDDRDEEIARRRAALTLASLAWDERRAGLPVTELAARLEAARTAAEAWPVLLSLAELRFAARDWGAATRLYQGALNDMDAAPAGEEPPSEAVIRRTLMRAQETQLLAPDERPPVQKNGLPGGVDLALRGRIRNLAVAAARPLPVTFVFGRAELTPEGERAAADWHDSLRAEPDRPLILVGHTDPVGPDAINDPLSLARAEALARLLRDRGHRGPIRAEGRGRRCPIPLSDPDAYTEPERHQILRRVEVIAQARLPENHCRG